MVTLVPRVRAGVDVRKLPLDPTDGFVLTRIDGQTTVVAISQMTGLPEFSVIASVEKLRGLGAVDMIDPAAPPPNVPAPPPPPPPVEKKANSGTAGRSQRYPEAELAEEDVDIDMEHRRQVLDLFYDLDDLDHYTLLGLTREADKKAIKRAYYDLAARLHPDRFFRKRLGSFKTKMDVVFAKITTAHDVLTSKEGKVEYDSYLGDVVNTRALEAQLARAQEEIQLAKEAIEAQAQAAAAQALAAAALAPEPMRAPSPSGSDLELRARREALARRLGKAPSPGIAPPPPPSRPDVGEVARGRSMEENRDTVRRMYDDRLQAAKRAQVGKYKALGMASLAANDPVAASNALRMALSFDETDTEVRALYEDAEQRAAAILVETYMKAAVYEERSERFAEAARSYAKVSQLRPQDSAPADAAARCLVEANGNLHEAADLAKHAITLSPQNVKYRVTLANVYVAANLVLAAKRELENAARIDPKSTLVAEMLRRLPKPA